jgi:hypothetical protein
VLNSVIHCIVGEAVRGVHGVGGAVETTSTVPTARPHLRGVRESGGGEGYLR